ncbi:MAG: hypothetical protein K1X74_06950 [Pirellulales bacterium]|nr:hypothetical protein [Pirellulales bacterium]
MSSQATWLCVRRHAPRLLAVGAALAQLVLASGFPLWPANVHPVAAKSAEHQRYPCEDHRCGCLSADQCWRSCCCHTHAEKLQWARSQGIRPPDYLLALVEAETRERQVASPRRSCCHARPAAAPRYAAAKPARGPAAAPQRPARGGWVIGFQAQQCQGLITTWVALGAVVPPPPRVVAPGEQISIDTLAFCTWRPIAVVHRPEVPPPRCA